MCTRVYHGIDGDPGVSRVELGLCDWHLGLGVIYLSKKCVLVLLGTPSSLVLGSSNSFILRRIGRTHGTIWRRNTDASFVLEDTD